MIGFIAANIELYYQMEKKITEYETNGADLRMRFLRSSTEIYKILSGGYKGKLHEYDLEDNGLPISTVIEARIEIENLGREAGTPLWEIDPIKSDLPDIFSVREETMDGMFTEIDTLEIEGRSLKLFTWKLSIYINETDPEIFIERLINAGGYKFIMYYQTKRIGGYGKKYPLTITGNFDDYRKKLLATWKKVNPKDADFSRLIDLLEEENKIEAPE
jgi:hypothetical protein